MSKPNLKPDQIDKWEGVRRLRYGDFQRLFRDRYHSRGYFHFPDDDAGRGDLWLLVLNVSLAIAEPKKKMRHVIETWAPWLNAEEREAYIEHVWGLDFYERLMTAREIGERLGLTNAERERLKLWQFKPIDMTDEELAEYRKRKNNERRRAKRARTRVEYLASSLTSTKPWEAEGICRRTWERRRVATQGRNNSNNTKTTLATPTVQAERLNGYQRSAGPLVPATTNKSRKVESKASSSPALRPRVASNVVSPKQSERVD
jgi:hypothetical protein